MIRHEQVHQRINKLVLEYFLPLISDELQKAVRDVKAVKVSSPEQGEDGAEELIKYYQARLGPLITTFEKVLEIFADYLTADETSEVYISRHGCVRVEFDQDFHYCSGEVCHTPKELFDLLADDYRTYLEIELTKGKREVTEDDEREADALCKRHLERWKEEQE